jgi:predicted ArsR family transcriptional regulator
VVTTERGLTDYRHTTFERRDIVELCREPMSVAEISARLGLHLNVVRVLVADLYAEGRVLAHLAEFDASRDVDTLRRVIRGLRAIS